MNTILPRLKTLLNSNLGSGQTLSYVPQVEILHPDMGLSTISKANLPKIFLVPESSDETWIASQEKEAVHAVSAFLVMFYIQRESSIIGDASRSGGQGKGILDFVTDFLSVVRGHRLSVGGVPYLNKPLDVVSVDYIVESMGNEQGQLLIAKINMRLSRVFLQTTLPGNIS